MGEVVTVALCAASCIVGLWALLVAKRAEARADEAMARATFRENGAYRPATVGTPRGRGRR